MTIEKDEIDDDEDEDIETETYKKYRRVTVSLPNNVAEKAEEYAEEHNLKRSQVLALAIEKGLGDENRIFKKLNRIEAILKKNNSMAKSKEETELEDEKTPEEKVLTNEERENIAELLIDCNSTFTPFAIQGEDGFLAQVQERQLLGSIWTDEMLQILAENLSIGYNNWYLSKPEPQELIDACAKAMKLLEDQKTKLTAYFAELQGLEVEYTEAEETRKKESEESEE